MRASFEFITAFATGDENTLRPMLHPQMTGVLDDLCASEEWQEATGAIRQVNLVSCEKDPAGDVRIVFAIHSLEDAMVDSQSWKGTSRGDMILFEPYFELAERPVLTPEMESMVEEAMKAVEDEVMTKGRDPRDTDNPRDPRRRVPKQAPDPGKPGGPG
jgi:hypothetical protein